MRISLMAKSRQFVKFRKEKSLQNPGDARFGEPGTQIVKISPAVGVATSLAATQLA